MAETEDYVLSTVLGGDLSRYRALENDPEVASSLQARKLAVVGHDWKVTPAGKSKAETAIADLVKENLDSLNFDQLTYDALDALLMGYWVGEAIYNEDAKTTYIEEVRTRAQDRWTFVLPEGQIDPKKRGYTDGYEIRLCDRLDFKGEPAPARKIIVHSFGSKTHNPFGLGLGSKLYWPVTIKKDAVKLWLFYLDKFASPTPIGTYDPLTGNSRMMQEFLASIATGSYAALPTGYDVKLLEAQRSGSIDAYEGMINRFCNAEIGKVILGRMNVGANQGLSGQPAENDEAIRQDIVKADADLLCSRLNRTLVKWLTELNTPEGTKPPTVYRVFEESEDLKERCDRDKSLFDMGFRLSTKAQAEIYGPDYVDTSATAGKDEKAPPLVTSLGAGGTQALIGMLQQAAGGSIPRENAIAAITAIFGVEEEVAAAMVPEQAEGAGEPDLSSLIGGGDTGKAPPTEEPAAPANTGVEAAANLSEAQQEIAQAIALLAELEEADSLEVMGQAIAEFAEEIVSTVNFDEARSLNFLQQAIGRRVIELAQQRRSAEYQENDLIVTFSEDGAIEFAAAGGAKKPRNCNPAKSLSCGGSCQPLKTKSGKDTVCNNPLSAEGKAKAKKVKAALGGSDGEAAVAEGDTKATSTTKKDEADKAEAIAAKKRISTAPVVQDKLDLARSKLVELAGEDAVSRAEKNTQKLLDEADLYIRVPSNSILEAIVNDGRFKTQFETGKSKGALAKKLRSKAESEMFGYDEKIAPADRPIYGYFGNGEYDGDGDPPDKFSYGQKPLDMYGTIAVKLKKSAKEKASFTGNDSLNNAAPDDYKEKVYRPSQASKANAASLVDLSFDDGFIPDRLDVIANAKTFKEMRQATGPYIEAQIHQGVKTSDIEEIVYYDTGDKKKDSQPSAELQQWAKDNGVTITIKKVEKEKKNSELDDFDFDFG